jgi:hypothetical protein
MATATDNTNQQQIIREAPEIEAYKLKLLEESQKLAFQPGFADQIPGYQVAGFSPEQLTALRAAEQQGIGAFSPYVTAANQGIAGGMGMTLEAADVLRGADTRAQFGDAQAAMQQAGAAAAGMGGGIGQINTGLGYMDLAGQRALQSDTTGRFGAAYQDIGTGVNALATSQNMAARASQADLTPATAAIGQGMRGVTDAQRIAAGALGADFSGSQQLLQNAAQRAAGAGGVPQMGGAQGAVQLGLAGGLGGIGGGMGGYDPSRAQAFMDPYRQQVIDETMRQMDRQSAIAGQGLAAQAIRSGAFGGEREGVQRAEMQRNLLDQKSSTIANLLSQGYSQSQAQAMQAFEQQQGRQMQAGQGIGQLGAQQAQVAAQQGGLQQQAAQLAAQQAGLGVQAGSQVGSQAAQQAQLGQAAAGLYGNLAQNQVGAGQALGQLGVQQAQLGQGAAGQFLNAAQQYGNLASQGGALAGQEASINQNIANQLMQQSQMRNQVAQTAAGIYGQQAQQYQGIGQGIGQLAGQQFGIGQQTAQGLGALGGQLGQLGVQQGALGQTAQALQQGDINFLYNVGQSQQAFNQQSLDAQRASELQKVYAPYQQAGFLSDIYKGAPSSQMSTAVASQPSASPFQQAVGIGLGAVSTAAGAKRAGLFG